MDAMIKESVAALFCHVIKLDNKDLEVERHLFCRFIQQDFDSETSEEANKLLDEVMGKEYNIDTQISILANAVLVSDSHSTHMASTVC